MKILGVESSATAASAAVWADGKLVSLQFSNTGLTHSQTLLPMVDGALKTAGMEIAEMDYLAVAHGPGSFTGVRIGIATVKGLAQATHIPTVGVSTLAGIAFALSSSAVYAVAAMDARCRQVYTASFLCENGKMTRVTPDEALSLDALSERLSAVQKPIVFIGDGAALCFETMKDKLPGAVMAPETIRYQSAASIAALAAEIITENPENAVPAAALLPQYLRLSQAEREWNEKQRLLQMKSEQKGD